MGRILTTEQVDLLLSLRLANILCKYGKDRNMKHDAEEFARSNFGCACIDFDGFSDSDFETFDRILKWLEGITS